MLTYRIHKDNTATTKIVLPVNFIEFTDFSNFFNEADETEEYGNGNNINKIMLTCGCDGVVNLNNGDIVEGVNILTLEHGVYTFNNQYTINGINKEDGSFSIYLDKYYIFNVENILLDDFNDNEKTTIRLIINGLHYFDANDYSIMSGGQEDEYYGGETVGSFDDTDEDINTIDVTTLHKEQKIPIYFKYSNNGNTVVTTVYFEYYTEGSLITDKTSFEESDAVLYHMLFANNNNNFINEEETESINGKLSGIVVYRDNFLFGEKCNYYFQHQRAIANIPIQLTESFETNIYQSDLLKNNFVEDEKIVAINKIVDLEKDVYYPVIANVSGDDITGFTDVYTIKFNLHFREHRGQNWTADPNSLWNGVYNTSGGIAYDRNITGDDVSDLLTFLHFNNDDVHYQKNKLKKSFLRLLFYDSTNPANQNLLGYSTIFYNTGDLFAKYIKHNSTPDYSLIKYDKNKYGDYEVLPGRTGIMVDREHGIRVDREHGIRVDREHNNEDSSTSSKPFEEEYRLSSQFVVKSKNTSKSSSEGFYLYLWKDNENVLPQNLYMKVEFNHAGYGRTIPFMMPYWDKKKWPDKNKSGSRVKTFDNIITDWKQEKGFNANGDVVWGKYDGDTFVRNPEVDGHYDMRQYNKFSYIRLCYQYDEKTDKHVYYIDPATYGSTSTKNTDNKDIIINLYEAKVE